MTCSLAKKKKRRGDNWDKRTIFPEQEADYFKDLHWDLCFLSCTKKFCNELANFADDTKFRDQSEQ